LSGNITVTATFSLKTAPPPPPAVTYVVSITKGGSGAGTVSGGSIDCGNQCQAIVSQNVSFVLTAIPDNNSLFSGWSGGGCPATGNCTLNVSSNLSVGATFTAIPNTGGTSGGGGSGGSGGGGSGGSFGGGSSDTGATPPAETALPTFFQGSGTITLTLSGNNPAYVKKNAFYVDPGITVGGSDDFLFTILASVNGKSVGTVNDILLDTSTTTTYTISYSITDSKGQTGTATRNVIVTNETQTTGVWLTNALIKPILNTNNPLPEQKQTDGTIQTINPLVPLVLTLAPGISSPEIYNLQRSLSAFGFLNSGNIDGSYNSITTKAVQDFQLKYKIVQPQIYGFGLVGPKTKAKINELILVYNSQIKYPQSYIGSGGTSAASSSSAKITREQLVAQIREQIKKLQEQLVYLLGELVKVRMQEMKGK
jgi:peptidoglycan hydrolase-like protein with peptidoglycan-binding domain